MLKNLQKCELMEQQGAKDMLKNLQKCVKLLIDFGDVTETGMRDSRDANQEYVNEFLAVNDELQKMRESKELAVAFAEDNEAAFKVLNDKLDGVDTQISALAGDQSGVSTT